MRDYGVGGYKSVILPTGSCMAFRLTWLDNPALCALLLRQLAPAGATVAAQTTQSGTVVPHIVLAAICSSRRAVTRSSAPSPLPADASP